MNHTWTQQGHVEARGILPPVPPSLFEIFSLKCPPESIPLCLTGHGSSHAHTLALGEDETERGKLC